MSKAKLKPANYVIEGKISGFNKEKIDYKRTPLAVHAFIGEEVAHCKVNRNGEYKLQFQFKPGAYTVELKLLPEKFSKNINQALTFKKILSPAIFTKKKSDKFGYYAKYDLIVPYEYLLFIEKVTKTYHMYGGVFATTYDSSNNIISIDEMRGVKLDFYEVDVPYLYILGKWIEGEWVWLDPPMSESYLGTAITDNTGHYDFNFDFTYHKIWLLMFWPPDYKPDIRVRISQFQDGAWKQIHEEKIDWNISEDYHRDYFPDVEDTIPIPPNGVPPDEGFRFISLGLLPIDDERFSNGYVTSKTGDPITVSHQPLCDTLRIFGLFATSPPIAKYKVQIAEADETGPLAGSTWEDVTDPLHNHEWDSTNNKWVHKVLGPDPVTRKYENIDTEPEANWHEHGLKVTINSRNLVDGYYSIRILGYDNSDTLIVTEQMPVIRVDNSIPQTSFKAIASDGGTVSECGGLSLGPARWIKFLVTAYDPNSHMKRYWITGTRGKEATDAGLDVGEARPDDNDGWVGRKDYLVTFNVAALPAGLSLCPSVAYNFELHVRGLSTNGYNNEPQSQWVKKETNLIVTE